MSSLRLLIVPVLAAVLAGPALAQCPDSYCFSSNPLAGELPMSLGRASEAWCDGAPGQPGTMLNVLSWSGTTLGAEWAIAGMTSLGAVEVGRWMMSGTGWIDYDTNYVGGQFWLSGDREWSLDGNPLTGTVTSFNIATRVTYYQGEPASAASNFYVTGVFDGCAHCELVNGHGNAQLVWRPEFTDPMPADYPEFLCPVDSGELFDVCTIDITIMCGGTDAAGGTWSNVKSLYR
ncbi:MAG: hypothetical protein R6X25_02605 [Candidatus Krumholzibacteriia bacterium]